MAQILKSTLFALTALGLSAAPAVQAAPAQTGEEKLAKMLEGRAAGEPQNCIRTMPNIEMDIIDKTAIVFKDGRTLWVNRTRTPETLDEDDVLVIRKFGSAGELCSNDSVTTQDRGTGMFNGVVFLGDFVPYRMVEE